MSIDVTDKKEDDYKQVHLGPRKITLPKGWGILPVKELFEIKKESFNPDMVGPKSEIMLYSMPAYDAGQQPIEAVASEIGSKKYRVPNNTILFPKLNIRKRRFWRVSHKHETPAVCSTEYWPLLPKVDLELDFYYYYFDSYEFNSNPKITSSSSTNSHKRVKQSSFEKTQLPFPPLAEQRRIADILLTVDNQIQQTHKIIEETKELKRGLAQDLYGEGGSDDQFPDREPELPEGWSLKPISDLCSVGGGKTPSKSNSEYWGGSVLWASPKDFDGPLLENTEDKITKFSLSDTSLTTYSPGDIAIVVRSGVLRHTLPVAKLGSRTAVNQDVKVLQPNDSVINPEYLFQILRTQSNRIRQRCMKTGTTVESIETSFLKKYKLRIRPQEEQNLIAGLLSNIDEKIRLEQIHLDKTKELKRGLMQDLLTGKVRVAAKN